MEMYFCCRKVDYLNAKGFIKDPNTVVATLASGQEVCLLVFSAEFICEHVITDKKCGIFFQLANSVYLVVFGERGLSMLYANFVLLFAANSHHQQHCHSHWIEAKVSN